MRLGAIWRHPVKPLEGEPLTMKRVLAVASVLLLMTACGSDKGGGDASSKEDSRTLVGLLRSVPDSAENRGHPVYYGDLSRLRGGDRPSLFRDDVALLTDRSSSSLFLPEVMRATVSEPEFAEFAGFDTRAVEATFEFGALPESVAVFVGTMKAADIEKGLAASPGGDQLVKKEKDRVNYLSIGEEGRTELKSISAIRRLGEPLRMAVAGDTLYWSRTSAAIDAAVACSGGKAKSLADDANYTAVAKTLDAADVVNGIVVSPSAGESWLVAGLGETFHDNASTLTVALQFADAATATSAATAFRAHVENDESLATSTPWAKSLIITDAHADGPLMVATLTSNKPGIAEKVVLTRDNLLQF